MVPALTEGGRSFKGASRYYLHDKRTADEAERFTSDRVAWVETVNLPTADRYRAWRMMAHTAMAQAELKAAAGEKATGRKLEKPVLAYSLSWHPEERPTKEQQIEAARETLKVLGLAEHQAMIISHNDEPHAHVHVLVNRVHPETGKAAPLSNSKRKLSEWALKYEKERGKIYCEERARNADKRKRGERTRSPRQVRPVHEAMLKAGNDNLSAAFVLAEQKQKDARLFAAGRALDEKHRQERHALNAAYHAGSKSRQAVHRTKTEQIVTGTKQRLKPKWAALFKEQRAELRGFEARETVVLGKLWNMAETAFEMKGDDTDRNLLGALYSVFSAHERRAVFDRKQDRERRELADAVRAAIRANTSDAHKLHKLEMIAYRADYLRQVNELEAAQAIEVAEHKAQWAARHAERRAAHGGIRTRKEKWALLQETVQWVKVPEAGKRLELRRDLKPK